MEVIDYYPAWVDKANLRFVYRMWKEPHTYKVTLWLACCSQPDLSQKESLDGLVEPMDWRKDYQYGCEQYE